MVQESVKLMSAIGQVGFPVPEGDLTVVRLVHQVNFVFHTQGA